MLVDRWSRCDFPEPGQLPHRVSKYSSHFPSTITDFLTFRHLANRSFQKPLVQDYVSRCSTLWGRFLCMIVRSIDSAQSMLFFDDEQVVATLALLEALQDGKGGHTRHLRAVISNGNASSRQRPTSFPILPISSDSSSPDRFPVRSSILHIAEHPHAPIMHPRHRDRTSTAFGSFAPFR